MSNDRFISKPDDLKVEKPKSDKKPAFQYPEMKLDEISAKKAAGYTFKAAKDSDYKDESKKIVTVNLPKQGFTPFVMIPPAMPDNKTINKPMHIIGDPTKKTKIESFTSDEEDKIKLHMTRAVDHFKKARHSKDKSIHMRHFNNHSKVATNLIKKAEKENSKSSIIKPAKHLLKMMGYGEGKI